MYRSIRLFVGLLCVAGLFAAGSAQATPTTTVSATDGDLTITLTLDNTITEGASGPWGTLEVVITMDDYDLTTGDSGRVSVWEDTGWSDTELWGQDITVTAAELTAGAVTRTFNVSWLAAPESSTDNVLEVYGYTEFDKYESYWWNDLEAQTGTIDVTVVPEPGTFALLSLGLLGLAVYSRRTS